MHKIQSIKEISLDLYKISCGYTGAHFDDTLERKLYPIKKRLVRRALRQYTRIATCGENCFLIRDSRLEFWFNNEELSTRVLAENISN